jgi:hypothetical protein
MEKTITLFDLKQYLQEINQIEKSRTGSSQEALGPSDLTIQTILRYSRALNILKTQTAGTIYHLAN